MIYIDLHNMLNILEKYSGSRVSLRKLALLSNIHVNTLSRNLKSQKTTTEVIGKLVEFFFHALRHSPQCPATSEEELVRFITVNLIRFYPDSDVYHNFLPSKLKSRLEKGSLSPVFAWRYRRRARMSSPLRPDEFSEFTKVVSVNPKEKTKFEREGDEFVTEILGGREEDSEQTAD